MCVNIVYFIFVYIKLFYEKTEYFRFIYIYTHTHRYIMHRWTIYLNNIKEEEYDKIYILSSVITFSHD